MPATESERLALHEQLAEKIGPEPAGTLMNQLPRVDSDELATKTDLRQLGGQLQAEMSGLKSEMRGEMRGLQGEMKELRAEMLSELIGMRGKMESELTGLRAELTDKLARHTRTTILAMLAMTVPIWVSMLVAVFISSTA